MMNEPKSAIFEVEYEDGSVTTALLDPEKAEKVLQGMRAGSVGRPLPDFKEILLSESTTETAAE